MNKTGLGHVQRGLWYLWWTFRLCDHNIRYILTDSIQWVILTGPINMSACYSNCTHFFAFTVSTSITSTLLPSHAKGHRCHFSIKGMHKLRSKRNETSKHNDNTCKKYSIPLKWLSDSGSNDFTEIIISICLTVQNNHMDLHYSTIHVIAGGIHSNT